MLDECILKYMIYTYILKAESSISQSPSTRSFSLYKSALFIYAHFIVFFGQFVYSPKSATETARRCRSSVVAITSDLDLQIVNFL